MILSSKKTFRAEEKVLVECDFKASPKCKGQYLKLYKNILQGRANSNGKDRCCYCFNSLTKTGAANYNFKYAKNENFFEAIDTELKAYLLGFIAGDGSIKKDGLFLENHVLDVEILELFQKHISPQSKLHKHWDPVRGANTICLKIHSVKIVNDLLKHLKLLAPGKKSDKIRLPDLPNNLLEAFVRGLFDSDGWICRIDSKRTSPACGISSTSIQMQQDLMALLTKHDIKYVLTSVNSSLQMTGQHCLKFLDKLYNEAEYFLTRKHALWLLWRTWEPGYGTEARPRKVREFYPPISEAHKESIRASNRERKGRKHVRN